MINRLTSAALALILVGCLGTAALAAAGGRGDAGNAAISQYEAVTPYYESPGGNANGANGVEGAHESGGEGRPHRRQPSPEGEVAGVKRGSKPVETASTGPVSAAGGLPFTGFDALALAGIGVLLVAAGVAQRRFDAERRS